MRASTAENGTNWDFVCCATSPAKVVFPQPGGPQKITEESSSRSIAFLKGRPRPTTSSCPTRSSKL